MTAPIIPGGEEPPTVLIPRHGSGGRHALSRGERLYRFLRRYGPLYGRRVMRWTVFLIVFLLFCMLITQPPHPITDACNGIRITVPTDVNRDGFIDCRSPEERGDKAIPA